MCGIVVRVSFCICLEIFQCDPWLRLFSFSLFLWKDRTFPSLPFPLARLFLHSSTALACFSWASVLFLMHTLIAVFGISNGDGLLVSQGGAFLLSFEPFVVVRVSYVFVGCDGFTKICIQLLYVILLLSLWPPLCLITLFFYSTWLCRNRRLCRNHRRGGHLHHAFK